MTAEQAIAIPAVAPEMRTVAINGVEMSFADACKAFGISRHAAHRRVKSGMSAVDAVTKPLAKARGGRKGA